MPTAADAALKLLKSLGTARVRDAKDHGVHPEVLRRLVAQGRAVKIARGMYQLPDGDPSEDVDLSLSSIRVPRGVVCLVSALYYHAIGTQIPHQVWMMIHRRDRKPKADWPPMRFVLGSGAALNEGIDEVRIDGRPMRIFNPAKTVVDCFAYRRHVGLDVALEAMRESLRGRRCSPAEIDRYARLCGMSTVTRPYLEAMA